MPASWLFMPLKRRTAPLNIFAGASCLVQLAAALCMQSLVGAAEHIYTDHGQPELLSTACMLVTMRPGNAVMPAVGAQNKA